MKTKTPQQITDQVRRIWSYCVAKGHNLDYKVDQIETRYINNAVRYCDTTMPGWWDTPVPASIYTKQTEV